MLVLRFAFERVQEWNQPHPPPETHRIIAYAGLVVEGKLV
jgi:hypothetical protein